MKHIDLPHELQQLRPVRSMGELGAAAFEAGRLVVLGVVGLNHAVDRVTEMAVAAGLVAEYGEDAVQATIADGFRAADVGANDAAAGDLSDDDLVVNNYEPDARAPKETSTRGRHLVSRRASEVAPRDIEFLWEGRLARGKHTCVGGEPASVLDLPISLSDETIRRVKGIFDLGSRLSEFLSSLRPRTLAWSATAAAVVILVQAAVITAVLVKEQGASSGPSLARIDTSSEPDVGVQSQISVGITASSPRISEEAIAALVAGGRQLMVAGDIPNARLALQPLAEIARNATAALELGATYDPTILQQRAMTDMADVGMARLWYEKARDLGSTEAAVRLEKLRSVPSPGR